MPKIIDTHRNTAARADCLRREGVSTVIRYYNFQNSRVLPEKRMELAEAETLSGIGIDVAVVFQQAQDRAHHFSRQKGLRAGRRAYTYAEDNIGQPEGSAIYFAVDYDASDNEIDNAIVPYFEGVAQGFAEESDGEPAYRVGVYGSGLVSSRLKQRSLIELIWLSMSRGFRGTREAMEAGEFNLVQRYPPVTLCGMDVDLNEVNSAQPDIGSFRLDGQAPVPGPDDRRGAQYRVIARNGLNLREAPTTSSQVIGGLYSNQIVFVTGIVDGWARVDVQGDGQVDGFAYAGFLELV